MNLIILLLFLIILIIIYIYFNEIQMHVIFFLILKRGIIQPNCEWWNISDIILGNNGITKFYKKLQCNYNNLYNTFILNTPVKVVLDRNLMEYILNNSPTLFGPGKFKNQLFSSFMPNNLGISIDNEWNIRRLFNEKVLKINHVIYPFYNDIVNVIKKYYISTPLNNMNSFTILSKKITSIIIFGEENNQIFNIFNSTNKLSNILNHDNDNNNNFIDYINNNNNKNCLLYYAKKYYDNKLINIYGQIPHWMFPISGSLSISLMRTIHLVLNDNRVYDKLLIILDEYNINSNVFDIMSIEYLQWIIFESLRINNPVQTLLRKALKDNTFNNISIKKNDEFIILTNPFMRDEIVFINPNKFNPDRWNNKLNFDNFFIVFGLGPQICPGKNLSLMIMQIALFYIFKSWKIYTNKIWDNNNLPDMLNPCIIKFKFKKL